MSRALCACMCFQLFLLRIHLCHLCDHIKDKNGNNNNTNDSRVELIQQYEDPECLSATTRSRASGAAEEGARLCASAFLTSAVALEMPRFIARLSVRLGARPCSTAEPGRTQPFPSDSLMI